VPAREIATDDASRTVVTEYPPGVSPGATSVGEAPAPASENVPEPGSLRTFTRADWKAAGLLSGVPALVFTLAAAIGYPLITGDNLVQNYPLEYFSGQAIRNGHLPLFDAFLWSGTPLLGGTNAHALLPLTLLFAVLPPLAAWVVGQIFVIAAAAIGCQLFLRRTGCGSLAAALGGASFGLGGFLSSQNVHIDFVAAAAALPWALIALHGLATRSPSSRVRHCLLLVAVAAWICLTGSPDIVIDVIVGCGGYFVHLLLQPISPERRSTGRLRLCAWAAGGGITGLLIGALQWAPSFDFVSVSERANPTFAYITGGSLDFGNFLELLVPHVFGATLLGSRKFGGTFPLSEINAYPGTLLLAALLIMLVSWRRADAWRWRVWLLVCGAAIVLVSGGHTPVEHLVAALPVVGKQRLPNRALILFSLSASLLGAYCLDWLLVHHPSRRQIAAGFVAVLGIVGVVVATLVTGKPAGGALVPHPGTGWTLAGVVPALAISLALAAAVGWFLLFGRRLTGRRRRIVITLLVLVDLAIFDANQTSYAPVAASALQPTDHTLVSTVTGDGRYLMVDPYLHNGTALDAMGGPDLGLMDNLPDAGGYSSLAWGRYDGLTGTHRQDGLSPSAITNGTLTALSVTTIFTVQSEVISPVTNANPPFELAAGSRIIRWFGGHVKVTSITVHAPTASPASLRQLGSTVRLVTDGGAPASPKTSVSTSGDEVTVRYPVPVIVTGLELGGPGVTTPVAITEPTVRPFSKHAFVTGGQLESALGAAHWVEIADQGTFATFVNPRAVKAYRVTAGGAVATVLSSNQWTGGASVEVTTPQAAALVRSVADIPGWRATVSHDGHVRSVPVRANGLIQRVEVAAGTTTVTFFYVAPGWREGQILALVGSLAFAGLGIVAVVGGRRRRPRSRKKRLSEGGGTSLAPA